MKKVRESNFELMRIISMFFIVIYHFLVVSGGQLINHTTGFTQMFCELLSLLIIVHVNSFVLISGYFQYNKKTSLKKVTNLITMALFYSIVIALIFDITGLANTTFLGFIKVFSPIEFPNLWFLIMYIALYLLAPYLNILIEKLNQTEHRKLLILLFIMFSIIPLLTYQNTFSNDGFTIIHFIFLYLLGAYLKKYPISQNIHFKNYSSKKKTIIFSTLFLILGFINFLLFFFSKTILEMNPGEFITYVCNAIKEGCYLYSNPIIIVQSICYFLIFENFNIKSNIINYISSSLFATYIITENTYILPNLYGWVGINTGKVFNGFGIVGKMFLWAIIIFVSCIIIECIRKEVINIFKKIKNHKKKEKSLKTNVKKVKVKTISVDL